MTKGEKIIGAIVAVVLLSIVSMAAWVNMTHVGRATWNLWFGSVQKVDDATNYETRKEVEDSCRAIIASYEADKFTWEQYKDSESSEQRSWADQAKMRANRTAATYNNYILKNSYVWSGNIPDDILSELEVIGGNSE